MNLVSKMIGLCVLICAVMSCGLIDKITSGGPEMVRANEMWSDVPKMDGFTKSDLELPVTVKLLMRTAINNLWRADSNSDGKAPIQGDWIVFAGKATPADVQAFYTTDRMTSFGKWDSGKTSTCTDGSESGGGFCIFEKHDGDKQTKLLIAAITDSDKKVTNVFFLRLEGDKRTLGNNSSSK